ncbi:hypothetical protein QF037_009817 [Streptomyces canus]|nr:hypothetical protein [Streptomyces canus]
MILLRVRRFICGNATCSRRTFAEPFAQLTAPYARFTTRLNRRLEDVGLVLAGRAGARLAAQLGLGAGRMTLLRRVLAGGVLPHRGFALSHCPSGTIQLHVLLPMHDSTSHRHIGRRP